MQYSLRVKTEPEFEPVSLAEAKAHLRKDASDEDDLIGALVQAAREWCENYTRRSFVSRTLELRMDCFPGEILLPRGPVLSVTSVEYVNEAGDLATVSEDAYQVDLYSLPARVVPVFGGLWPTPKSGSLNAVLVTYTAGYPVGSPQDAAAAQESVPATLKSAIKLIVGHLYENREAVSVSNMTAQQLPFAVQALLAPLEIRDFRLE